jgi:sugar phosphate isomerase/epimerase
MPDLDRRRFLAATATATASAAFSQQAIADNLPKFKLGLVTYNVAPNWDLATLLRICKNVGISAIECRTTHKHGVEPSLNADQRKEVKSRFADAGIVFWGCGSVCEFHSPDPAVVQGHIEDCKRFLELVKDLGGRGVKVRPNGVAKGQTVEQACAQIGKALISCGEAAGNLGLEIWVEVHGAVTAHPANMRRIIDACGHPAVGVTWNSNESDLIDGSLEQGFALLAPFIRSCHITDLKKDAAGTYPYRDLFRRLRELNYDRYTLCEYGKSFEPAEGEVFLREYAALWKDLSTK